MPAAASRAQSSAGRISTSYFCPFLSSPISAYSPIRFC